MRNIGVLLVDDSIVVRRMVTMALRAIPHIEVIGSAANGRIALAKLKEQVPDVIIMDVEMPDMDGLETLRELRKDFPKLPVIMFSTLTERCAAATLDALAAGANDYVHKPANVGSVNLATERIQEQLVPKIRALTRIPNASATCEHEQLSPSKSLWAERSASSKVAVLPPPTPSTIARLPLRKPFEIVVIGVSTGGPVALDQILPEIPRDFPVPILVVQHMPPMFTRLLAERLDSRCALTVREAKGGETPVAGEIWIAPGDHHMILTRSGLTSVKIDLNQNPQENSCRPAVDPLFRSTAEIYGSGTLGVVLTGMGKDGLAGAKAIKEAGGRILVQDEASSVVWGMPGFIASAGLADAEIPLTQIAAQIVRWVKSSQYPYSTTR